MIVKIFTLVSLYNKKYKLFFNNIFKYLFTSILIILYKNIDKFKRDSQILFKINV
jgi:hypothetical protein